MDAVDACAIRRMIFINWNVLRGAIDESRTRKNDPRCGVEPPACLENDQMAAAVDIQIEQGIAVAVDVAHLGSQVEDIVYPLNGFLHESSVADVTFDEFDLIRDGLEIKRVAPV